MQKLAPLSVALAVTVFPAFAQAPTAGGSDLAQAEKRFNQTCAGCHGQSGTGGDRAPALVNNRGLRTRSEKQIADLIRNGTRGGMPAFPLPEQELSSLARWVRSLNMSAFDTRPSGDAVAGGQYFFAKGQCSGCHMVGGRGKVNGTGSFGRRPPLDRAGT
jgi:mono/diheme cytochrome c family protein